MGYQNDDLTILVPVVNGAGEPVPASDYVNARYTITTLGGQILFDGHLGQGVTITNDDFVITVPGLDYSGTTRHEMRVWAANGRSKTLLQADLTVNATTIERSQP